MSSPQAICAKAIRKELKESFKDTKFSVTSSKFGHSNGVDIRWSSCPPTREEVWAIVDKYNRYQGMDASDNTIWNCRHVLPQVDFVRLHNHNDE